LKLDPLLLRPRHVVRPKQPCHLHRKLHPRTRVGGEQFLPNCDVHHAPQDSQFLIHSRRLKPVFFDDTGAGLDLNTGLESLSKVMLDIICGDIAHRRPTKRRFEVIGGSFVRLVSLLCADRRPTPPAKAPSAAPRTPRSHRRGSAQAFAWSCLRAGKTA
jgi:hypothetical protein